MNFRPEMVAAIRRGEKTQTRRVANDNPNSPWYRGGCAFRVDRKGGYAICPGRAKTAVGRLVLTSPPKLARLGEITDEEAVAESFREGRREFRHYWEQLHKDFDLDLSVWVVRFVPIFWADGKGWTAA